ncbi:MAG: polysaccharide biosynthesis protein [Ruminococcaceae bacterium]|nr:polysaccharide biosynthesis protein [Oscillospiraceae bacterium]
MSEPKKQSFLHGTMLLTIAAIVVKVIGAIYKIPLNDIIGEQGFGYYNTAYEIYNVLLTISVTGLPVAISRMISEANALGHHNQVRQIYRTGRSVALTLGIIGSLLMTIFCRELAQFQEQPDAWFAIGCLGPALLLICILSTFRGFFQGQGNMGPTSISQMLEAVCKLIVGMTAAVILLNTTGQYAYAAGGAILGVTTSCVVSAIYLFIRYQKAKKALPTSDEPVISYGRTLRSLLAIAIPITIGSAGLSILTVLETKVYMSQLMGLGYSQDQADVMKGIYDMSKTIFNLPIAFVAPVTISIVPAITAHVAVKNYAGARTTEESALRVLSLIITPCSVGLIVLAKPVMALLGHYSAANLPLAGNLMALLASSILFYAMIMVTNSIMQAHGHANLPVINMVLGGLVKLGATYVLTGNPELGILGAPIGALLGHMAIMVLNLITLRRCTEDSPALLRQLVKPIAASLLMGAMVLAARLGLERLLGPDCSNLILTALPILVGVAVYAFTAIKLKAITREDCLLLPKGEKIADLLHL